MRRRSQHHPATAILLVGLALALLGMLILFASQTLGFVNWLYPSDELFFKILTFVCFDVLSFVWALVVLLYKYADERAKTVAWVAAVLDFLLSLVASVLYLIIQNIYRFHLVIDPNWVVGSTIVTIVALVANILLLVVFLTFDVPARIEADANHKRYVRQKRRNVTQSNGSNVTQQQLAQNSGVTQSNGNVTPMSNAVRQQRYRQRKKGQFLP